MQNIPTSLPIKPFALIATLVVIGLISSVAAIRADQVPAAPVKPKISTGEAYTLFIPNYSNVSSDKIDQTTDDLSAQQYAIKANLLSQLKHNDLSNRAKADVIYLLGSLVDYGAVDELIRNINFLDERPIIKSADQPRSGYIARRSLVALGRVSVNAILSVIGSQDQEIQFDPASVDAYCDVLSGIEGPRLAMIELQERFATAKGAKVRSQYATVIKQLKKYQNIR